jgi:hypothetical protein
MPNYRLPQCGQKARDVRKASAVALSQADDVEAAEEAKVVLPVLSNSFQHAYQLAKTPRLGRARINSPVFDRGDALAN